ncbi:MAG: HIT domain-containing protein [Erysipelotrichaceae bacterium]|jgi:histidine triad (HIT) family protein|nr:HIT domain-containing protein [Erysipelotrichaceae bacterium]
MDHLKNSECIFCKIVQGSIPCYHIYEDDTCLAFLDVAPLTTGHTLLIPKSHYVNLLDTPSFLIAHLNTIAKRIARHYLEALGATGFKIHTNVGKNAGQVVNHYHIHIIPYYPKNSQLNEKPQLSNDAFQDLASKIKLN